MITILIVVGAFSTCLFGLDVGRFLRDRLRDWAYSPFAQDLEGASINDILEIDRGVQ